MVKKLCTCIVGKNKGDFLEECIDACLKLSDSIAYLDLGSTDNSVDLARKRGIRVVESGPSGADAESLLKQYCGLKWVLFLRPNEKPILKSGVKLEKILTASSSEGYSLVIKEAIAPEILDSYQWTRLSEQYKESDNTAYASKIEVRLVRQPYLGSFMRLMATGLKEDEFSFRSEMLREIQVHPCQRQRESKEDDRVKTRECELKYLKGELFRDLVKEDNLSELREDYIGYAVITKEDLPRYYRGLSMGFGSEKMYLTMLHYLAKLGWFEEARDLFEAWKDKWGFFDRGEVYRVGGIIYAHLFDLDKTVSCLEECIQLTPEDHLAEPLSLLGKAYLLRGDREKAVSLLRRSIELADDQFNSMVVEALENDSWKPPRLSVCMIARDEEASIRRALESVSGIADEIIVVDTGSTDNTREIIGGFNAKIIETTWEDNFSKARNLGLQEATGDYILCLDADEFIDVRQRIRLALTKQILPAERDTAFRINIEPEQEDEEMLIMLRLPKKYQTESPIRLFPAGKGIHFEGEAFESVDKSIEDTSIRIEWNKVFEIAHANSDRLLRDRRKEVAARRVYDSISDPEAGLKGFLYFLRLGELDAALKWLEKSDADNPQLLAKVVELCVISGQAASAARFVDNAMEEFPESLELQLAKAEIDFSDGKFDEVHSSLGECINTIRSRLGGEYWAKACYLYGMALLEEGDMERGIEYLIEARSESPWDTKYKIGGIYALARCEEWEAAVGALSDVLKEEQLKCDQVVNDFADFGIILARLGGHFAGRNRMDLAALCRKMAERIILHKISEKAEIEKLSRYLNTFGFVEEGINA